MKKVNCFAFVRVYTIGLIMSEKFSSGTKNPKQTNTIGAYLQMMVGIIRVYIYIDINVIFTNTNIFHTQILLVVLYFIFYNLDAISLFDVNA